jgi:hypothetical protein
MPRRPSATPRGDQRWPTFLKNHAKAIRACDFFVAVTATFRMLYVFVVIDHGTRRLKLVHVTPNPSAEWTLQQLLYPDRALAEASRCETPGGQGSLRRAIREYVEHYHKKRNHQGLQNRLVCRLPKSLTMVGTGGRFVIRMAPRRKSARTHAASHGRRQ